MMMIGRKKIVQIIKYFFIILLEFFKNIYRETELYAKREEVWREIEELARKNNPQFESLINHMEYFSISNNNDWNEDDFSSDKIDHYSKDVRRII